MPSEADHSAVPMVAMTYFLTVLATDEAGNLRHVPLSADDASIVRFASPDSLGNTALADFSVKPTFQGVNLVREGIYLCAEPGGIVVCDRTYPSIWEQFILLPEDVILRYMERWATPEKEEQRFAETVSRLTQAGEPVKIYFGAGQVPRPGFLNIDIGILAPQFAAEHPDEYFVFPFTSRRWPIGDQSVDYIFHEDFLEHIPQVCQWQFLAEARRVLKDGAWHRVNTPCIRAAMLRHSNFEAGFDGVYTGEVEHEHIAMVTPASLKEMAEVVGYSQVVFTPKHCGRSPYAVEDFRPGADRDDVTGNVYADLLR